MAPIDPRLVKAKRFPVHAAVDRCNAEELIRLLEEDAPFHVVRKLPDTGLSVLHTACSARHGPSRDDRQHQDLFVEIVKYLINMGATVDERDSIGQTPLHYAVCHMFGHALTRVLVERGADPNLRRSTDGWTPLHLAAMLGHKEAVHVLLGAGADPAEKDLAGQVPEDVARRHRHFQLADFLQSPRAAYKPNSKPETLPDRVAKLLATVSAEQQAIPKFKDEVVDWRDEDGNTFLHLAAWAGDLRLVRSAFESVKARKLVGVQNRRGATPLAMAIISGQETVVEEFFMHRHSKKLIDLDVRLADTDENLVHLLLLYCPYVHPKFLLKRKDLTKAVLNAPDKAGASPLLRLASRNSRPTIRRILASKNLKEGRMLDLASVAHGDGTTVLHHLVRNRDEEAVLALMDREELTPEVANSLDSAGQTPLMACLVSGSPFMARDILEHPTASLKFRMTGGDGRELKSSSLLHLVAEHGNQYLWRIASARPEADLGFQDDSGNTALMKAVLCRRSDILEAWLRDALSGSSGTSAPPPATLQNKDGKTILSLMIENLSLSDLVDPGHVAGRTTTAGSGCRRTWLLPSILKAVDFKDSINSRDKDGRTALHAAASKSYWAVIREILTSPELRRVGPGGVGPEDEGIDPGAVDVHPEDPATQLTVLVTLLVARVRLIRQEQTCLMKKQRNAALEAKVEAEQVWEVAKLVLIREKELHLHRSAGKAAEEGTACIRAQMAKAKAVLRAQEVEEVAAEFNKLFQFVIRKNNKKVFNGGDNPAPIAGQAAALATTVSNRGPPPGPARQQGRPPVSTIEIESESDDDEDDPDDANMFKGACPDDEESSSSSDDEERRPEAAKEDFVPDPEIERVLREAEEARRLKREFRSKLDSIQTDLEQRIKDKAKRLLEISQRDDDDFAGYDDLVPVVRRPDPGAVKQPLQPDAAVPQPVLEGCPLVPRSSKTTNATDKPLGNALDNFLASLIDNLAAVDCGSKELLKAKVLSGDNNEPDGEEPQIRSAITAASLPVSGPAVDIPVPTGQADSTGGQAGPGGSVPDNMVKVAEPLADEPDRKRDSRDPHQDGCIGVSFAQQNAPKVPPRKTNCLERPQSHKTDQKAEVPAGVNDSIKDSAMAVSGLALDTAVPIKVPTGQANPTGGQAGLAGSISDNVVKVAEALADKPDSQRDSCDPHQGGCAGVSFAQQNVPKIPPRKTNCLERPQSGETDRKVEVPAGVNDSVMDRVFAAGDETSKRIPMKSSSWREGRSPSKLKVRQGHVLVPAPARHQSEFGKLGGGSRLQCHPG